jgi:hypothetical protein
VAHLPRVPRPVAVGVRNPGSRGHHAHARGHPNPHGRAGVHPASSDHSGPPSGRASRRGCRVDRPSRHERSHQRARFCHRRRHAHRYPNHPRRAVDCVTRFVANDPIRSTRHRASPSGFDVDHHPHACFVETAPDPGDHHHPNGLCPCPSVSHAGCRARQLLAVALIGEHIQHPRVILTLSHTQPSVSYSANGSTTHSASGLESAQLARATISDADELNERPHGIGSDQPPLFMVGVALWFALWLRLRRGRASL